MLYALLLIKGRNTEATILQFKQRSELPLSLSTLYFNSCSLLSSPNILLSFPLAETYLPTLKTVNKPLSLNELYTLIKFVPDDFSAPAKLLHMLHDRRL